MAPLYYAIRQCGLDAPAPGTVQQPGWSAETSRDTDIQGGLVGRLVGCDCRGPEKVALLDSTSGMDIWFDEYELLLGTFCFV